MRSLFFKCFFIHIFFYILAEYDRGASKSEATDADGEPVSEVTKQLDEMSIKDDQPKMKNLSKMPSKGDMLIAFPTYAGRQIFTTSIFCLNEFQLYKYEEIVHL